MGVMCSLLGHDYGDPEVERERDENGNEVVLTAKRVQRCRSCGHERTISENTEVTALSAAAGVVREPDGTVVAAPDGSDGDAVADERAGAGTGSVARNGGQRTIDEAERNDGARADATEPAAEREIDTPSVDPDGPAVGSESRSGLVTDSVTATSALDRPTDGPAEAGADDASTEERPSIDRIDDEPTHGDRPRRAPGEWPAEPERPPGPAAGADGRSSESGGSVASAGAWPGDAAADPTDVTNGDEADDTTGRAIGGSFVCGSCGFDAVVVDSPHRAGDICPHCHRGYLAWETRKG